MFSATHTALSIVMGAIPRRCKLELYCSGGSLEYAVVVCSVGVCSMRVCSVGVCSVGVCNVRVCSGRGAGRVRGRGGTWRVDGEQWGSEFGIRSRGGAGGE